MQPHTSAVPILIIGSMVKIMSITAVNNALINFPGNVIFTSQDHQFVTTIADRIIEIKDDGTIADYYCNYEEYLEKIKNA